jgi:hypothetical protein
MAEAPTRPRGPGEAASCDDRPAVLATGVGPRVTLVMEGCMRVLDVLCVVIRWPQMRTLS